MDTRDVSHSHQLVSDNSNVITWNGGYASGSNAIAIGSSTTGYTVTIAPQPEPERTALDWLESKVEAVCKLGR